MLAAQALEVGVVDRLGHHGLDRQDGRAPSRAGPEECQLPERLPRSEDSERRPLAVPVGGADGDPSALDQVDGVGRIALVEDHLVAVERARAGRLEGAPDLRIVDVVEESPVHHRQSRR
jgi:hypothetical protein